MLSAWMVQVSVDWSCAFVNEWQNTRSAKRKAELEVVLLEVIVVDLQPSKANIQIIEYFKRCMRKALFITGVILMLLLAAIYLLIPSRLNVVVVLPVKCNVDAADRSLRDTA